MTASIARKRPVRYGVRHTSCTAPVKHHAMCLHGNIAERLASDPSSVTELSCSGCGQTAPVAEFTWFDGTVVGS